jgi:hypothetical protein
MEPEDTARRELADANMEAAMTDEVKPDEVKPDAEKTGQEEPVEEKHSFKEELRDGVAKVVGIAVEAGSMLSGHSGEMVSAEGELAKADAEKFIDRIDGEG